MFKVIVAGGRDFKDYELLRDKCRVLLANKLPDVVIVSGHAEGADKLGEGFGIFHDLQVERFPADWDDLSEPCVLRYTKAGKPYNAIAGHKRNTAMGEFADAGIIFDTGGKGTADMIRILKKLGKPHRIINCRYNS